MRFTSHKDKVGGACVNEERDRSDNHRAGLKRCIRLPFLCDRETNGRKRDGRSCSEDPREALGRKISPATAKELTTNPPMRKRMMNSLI